MEQATATRHSLHLQASDPKETLEIVRGARFEHYILGRANFDVRLAVEQWKFHR